jgi:hypothetical protein
MSFVPNPTQTNASSTPNNNGTSTSANQVVAVAAGAPAPEVSDHDLIFKIRTFDVFWVDKTALMYKDGIAKVRSGFGYRGAFSFPTIARANLAATNLYFRF